MEDTSTTQGGAGGSAVVGALVTIYGMFDSILVGLPIMALSAWGRPLVVFVVAAVLLVLVNGAFCTWLDHHWDAWVASGKAGRIEKRLQKMRTGGLMKHPAQWVERGSDGWFGLAAALTNAILAVALARVIAGVPVGARRVRIAALSYGIFFAALFSLLGFALGDVIRAL